MNRQQHILTKILQKITVFQGLSVEQAALLIQICKSRTFEANTQVYEAGEPSVPSSLAEELLTNPFMRTDQPEVIAAAERWAGRELSSPAEVFTALRSWKDKDYD